MEDVEEKERGREGERERERGRGGDKIADAASVTRTLRTILLSIYLDVAVRRAVGRGWARALF